MHEAENIKVLSTLIFYAVLVYTYHAYTCTHWSSALLMAGQLPIYGDFDRHQSEENLCQGTFNGFLSISIVKPHLCPRRVAIAAVHFDRCTKL